MLTRLHVLSRLLYVSLYRYRCVYLYLYLSLYMCMNGCVDVRYVQINVLLCFVVQPRHRQLGRFERHQHEVSPIHAHHVEHHPPDDPFEEHYDQHHLR